MILFLLYNYSSNILQKIYKIWITSIDIIWENNNEIEIEKKIDFPRNNSSSGKFVYPDTIIQDLTRHPREDDGYTIV
jgi:hypothetical protein